MKVRESVAYFIQKYILSTLTGAHKFDIFFISYFLSALRKNMIF